MYISQVKISNYKCFAETAEVHFQRGFNAVVGANSVGKTALLEAMSIRFQNHPHCSLRSKPKPSTQLPAESRVYLVFTLAPEELREILVEYQDGFNLALPPDGTKFAHHKKFVRNEASTVEAFGNWVMSQPTYSFGFAFGADREPIPSTIPSYSLYEASASAKSVVFQRYKLEHPNANPVAIDSPFNSPRDQEIGLRVGKYFRDRVYCFRAERVIETYEVGPNELLNPNANNLAQVLHNLQSNRVKFDSYNALVRQVLPQVQRVAVFNIGDKKAAIKLWSDLAEMSRNDLARSLSEVGTGVGQVLAILYVVHTSHFPSVILIDEPQSFLHPGAVRNLVEVLKLHPQHQFIVATHSPTVVTSSNPSTLVLVKQKDSQSFFDALDAQQTHHLRAYLAEIGARLSDVFGADNVLWVEGDTEEICFPLILEKVAKKPKLGTSVLKVRNTGDFQGRHRERAIELYQRLCETNSLIPPAVAFLFDSEGLTAQKKDELTKRPGPPKICFLPRRMYENYLLNPAAICSVTNGITNFSSTPLSPLNISDWIDENRQKRKYFDAGASDPAQFGPDWIKVIDAGKLLKQLFTDFSETRVNYDKTTHSVALTEWLLDNSSSDLIEVSDLLVEILS